MAEMTHLTLKGKSIVKIEKYDKHSIKIQNSLTSLHEITLSTKSLRVQ